MVLKEGVSDGSREVLFTDDGGYVSLGIVGLLFPPHPPLLEEVDEFVGIPGSDA